MAIYDGRDAVTLLRCIYDRGDWHRETGRWPNAKDAKRMTEGITTYCAARWADQTDPNVNATTRPFVVDVVALRADGGMREIMEAVAKIA